MITKQKIKDIVYGFAIGDALGVPFEFKPAEYCKKYYNDKYTTGTHSQNPGTWSDDTSILLCVLDSQGDIEKYKQNLRDWFNNDGRFNCWGKFDAGNGTTKAIRSDFTDNKESKGNACLCVALGCWLVGLSFEFCEKFVRLTHNNEDSVFSAGYYYLLLGGLTKNVIEKNLSNKGFCRDSIHIAANSINYGFDTDSHAAFTGSLAAMNYKIPKYYINNLQGKEKISNIFNNFIKILHEN